MKKIIAIFIISLLFGGALGIIGYKGQVPVVEENVVEERQVPVVEKDVVEERQVPVVEENVVEEKPKLHESKPGDKETLKNVDALRSTLKFYFFNMKVTEKNVELFDMIHQLMDHTELGSKEYFKLKKLLRYHFDICYGFAEKALKAWQNIQNTEGTEQFPGDRCAVPQALQGGEKS